MEGVVESKSAAMLLWCAAVLPVGGTDRQGETDVNRGLVHRQAKETGFSSFVFAAAYSRKVHHQAYNNLTR